MVVHESAYAVLTRNSTEVARRMRGEVYFTSINCYNLPVHDQYCCKFYAPMSSPRFSPFPLSLLCVLLSVCVSPSFSRVVQQAYRTPLHRSPFRKALSLRSISICCSFLLVLNLFLHAHNVQQRIRYDRPLASLCFRQPRPNTSCVVDPLKYSLCKLRLEYSSL